MLINAGRVSALGNKPWAGIELVSDITIEDRVYQIIQWAVKTFRSEPFQLLFPVKSYGIHGVQTLSPYLWARTAKLGRLKAVSSLYGVEGLVSDGNGQVIQVDNEFVQGVVAETRAAADDWSMGIRKGSFVRVLKGRTRMLCGDVKKIEDGVADVIVSLRLRTLRLKVPVSVLLNLGDVPKEKREYFYGEI